VLEIKIDLVPMGQEEGRKQIENMFIANVGHAYGSTFKYKAWIRDPRFLKTPAQKEKHCIATVLHDQNESAWKLVQEVLDNRINGK
jgi:hypothetical protein